MRAFTYTAPPIARDHPREVLAWLAEVEQVKTATGSRCLLEHVTNERWLEHFAVNDCAFDAVLGELSGLDDDG